MSILREKWEWLNDPDKFGAGILCDADGVPVNLNCYKKELAAMPDIYRAAKEVVDHGFAIDLGILIRALKKAGIE